jgi:C4-dicarboxylate-specific signal transduction histidine kinase
MDSMDLFIDLEVKCLGKMVLVIIRDNAGGLPLEVATSLRSGKKVTTKMNGNGIGILGASKLISDFGSQLEFEVVEGVGTKFYFTLTLLL